eukprot:12185838-Alexandrium_andersonii.AAC.1
MPSHSQLLYAGVRNLGRKQNSRWTGRSSNFGISELAAQTISELRSWLLKQLRNDGIGCSSNLGTSEFA